MRRRAKALAEMLLVDSGASTAYRRLTRRSIVLAYHNVVPAGSAPSGDAGLHIDEDTFKRQLDRLDRTHEIVPLRRLLAADEAERSQAALTFDDAYRGAVRVGVRETERRGLPATIFVPPGLLGDVSLWWDALATRGRLDPSVRQLVLEELGGRQDRALRWAEEESLGWKELPAHARTATEEELLAAADRPGVQLEAHGWRHGNLARLEEEEVEDECARAAEWLERRGGESRPILAYPYGRVSSRAEAVARKHFAAAVLVTGGTFHLSALSNRFRIPRVNIDANLSLRGFELRASGVTA